MDFQSIHARKTKNSVEKIRVLRCDNYTISATVKPTPQPVVARSPRRHLDLSVGTDRQPARRLTLGKDACSDRRGTMMDALEEPKQTIDEWMIITSWFNSRSNSFSL
jgi:hypothetical protein